jgi:hypothetical protein
MSSIQHILKERLLALPPRGFELFAGDLLTFIGLHDVSVTRYSGDGGIDASGSIALNNTPIAVPVGVQVKRYRRNNVQRSDIDRFIGALQGSFAQGIFITTAGYAASARLKAGSSIPRVATVDGAQLTTLMLRHRLGVTEQEQLDESYFAQFEIALGEMRESGADYALTTIDPSVARPEDDLITLRGLSHALRVDTSALRRFMERGQLLPDTVGRAGYFFRRDRVETIRGALIGRQLPADAASWRQEFLDFARSRNLTKSYKPVLLKALLKLVDRNGEMRMATLCEEFRAFYVARRNAGQVVEFGPPDISDTAAVSDAQLRHLIVRHPLERFLIKGFLEHLPQEGIVRFAPQLWAELRFFELLDVQQSVEEQLAYYYGRIQE